MGQKIHPEILRVGYIHNWSSTWFNERHFADYLLEDVKIREHIEGKLSHAGLSAITIRKDANEVRPDRRQGLDQQGRDHALGLRAGPHPDGGPQAGLGWRARTRRRAPWRPGRLGLIVLQPKRVKHRKQHR